MSNESLRKFLLHIAYVVPCHRKPDRCLTIRGKPMPICARCFSILMGYLFIPILFSIPTIPIWYSIILQIPMLIDGITQYLKWRNSNNYLRVTTGLMSGLGLSIFVVSGTRIIVSIT